LAENRKLLLATADKYGVRFFNLKSCIDDNKEFRYPFALMNPMELRQGVFGRELINGEFMDANDTNLDFGTLVELIFKTIPQELVITTELLVQDHI
jgi:hypothetical protein